jgi:hypothetical protein
MCDTESRASSLASLPIAYAVPSHLARSKQALFIGSMCHQLCVLRVLWSCELVAGSQALAESQAGKLQSTKHVCGFVAVVLARRAQ